MIPTLMVSAALTETGPVNIPEKIKIRLSTQNNLTRLITYLLGFGFKKSENIIFYIYNMLVNLWLSRKNILEQDSMDWRSKVQGLRLQARRGRRFM